MNWSRFRLLRPGSRPVSGNAAEESSEQSLWGSGVRDGIGNGNGRPKWVRGLLLLSALASVAADGDFRYAGYRRR
jgi:hypothetical protein